MAAGGSDARFEVRTSLRQGLLSSCSTIALIAAITFAPKDPTPAATSRFVLTLLLLTIILVGLTVSARCFGRWRKARRRLRFQMAPSAARDTLSHLDYEQRLAWSGAKPCLLAGYLAFASYLIAHWPQAHVLAPFKTSFGATAIILLALVPMLALRRRGHFINRAFLKRYLRQQIEHLEFKPARGLPVLALERTPPPPFEVTGPLRFKVNAFEFSFADFVANVVVLGQTGAGKTITVLNILLHALIASSANAELKIGGLVLDPKGGFYAKLKFVCERYGRADDLVVLDPNAWDEHAETFSSIAWNPLDNDDDALEIAARLVAVLKMLGLEAGNEGTFFLDSARTFLRHAIELVRAAKLTPAPSIVDVHRLCQESEKETPLFHDMIVAIASRYPDEVPAPIRDAIDYFNSEWRSMADRQKSGLRGTLTQLLDEFVVASYRDMFTRPSTISISDCVDQGKLLYVHMPAGEREHMSRVVTTLIKLEYQRQILKRPRKERPTFMLADEFQTYYTVGDGRGDSDVFERSRESNHANIVAAQNMRAFLKRTRNEHDVKNFLANCAFKLFLRNSDDATNQWASSLFATRSEFVITASEQAAADSGWGKRHHTNYGRASRVLPIVPPDAFIRLAIPVKGDLSQQVAASIIHLGSRGTTEHVELTWPVHPLE